MSTDEFRYVTLIVVDEAGRVCGQTDQRRVALPYWQEMKPVVAAFPGAVILRLLHVEPVDPGTGPISNEMSSRVWYLAQFPCGNQPLLSTVTQLPEHTLSDHQFRMPWAKPNVPVSDLDWAMRFTKANAKPVQHRTWNLSAIWEIPTQGESVWLKCVPEFFSHEAAVLRLLKDQNVPVLLAHDDYRLLLQGMPGTDGYNATAAERLAGIQQLVKLQKYSASRCEQFIQDGVPKLTLSEIVKACRILLSKQKAESGAEEFLQSIPERLALLADSHIADVLVHGDFHAGNTRTGVEPPVIFDWGDSFIGHPFLDIGWLPDHDLQQKWLALWQDEYPDEDIPGLWQAIRPIARLRTALVYDSFVKNIEPCEIIYHANDVVEVIDKFQE